MDEVVVLSSTFTNQPREGSGHTEAKMCVIHRQTDRQTDRQADRQADRQTDRQTGRQTDRQTDRQAGRQTDRQRQFTYSSQCSLLPASKVSKMYYKKK